MTDIRQKFCAVLLMACALGTVGCRLPRAARQVNYQTVQSDPNHDTNLAIEEHENALVEMNRYVEGSFHGDLEKAKDHLEKALIADITYGPAHNTLAAVYQMQDNLYLAAWEYEYAVKLMPNQMEPKLNLGLVYEAAGDLDQAIVYFHQAHSLKPKSPEAIGSLARAMMRNGEHLEAVRPLLKDLLFYETRPEWVEWASNQLGTHPEHIVVPCNSSFLEDDEENPDSESATCNPGGTPLPSNSTYPTNEVQQDVDAPEPPPTFRKQESKEPPKPNAPPEPMPAPKTIQQSDLFQLPEEVTDGSA